nr:hypothetical protein Iba_chr05aCG6010 [Ipomoea batatas]
MAWEPMEGNRGSSFLPLLQQELHLKGLQHPETLQQKVVLANSSSRAAITPATFSKQLHQYKPPNGEELQPVMPVQMGDKLGMAASCLPLFLKLGRPPVHPCLHWRPEVVREYSPTSWKGRTNLEANSWKGRTKFGSQQLGEQLGTPNSLGKKNNFGRENNWKPSTALEGEKHVSGSKKPQ